MDNAVRLVLHCSGGVVAELILVLVVCYVFHSTYILYGICNGSINRNSWYCQARFYFISHDHN